MSIEINITPALVAINNTENREITTYDPDKITVEFWDKNKLYVTQIELYKIIRHYIETAEDPMMESVE